MKISNSLNTIYQQKNVQRAQTAAEAQQSNRVNSEKQAVINHVNIPKNFEPKTSLSKDEQQFFEGLYPKAKREIGRYMQNQNLIQVDKGKHVDIRG